VSDPRSGLATLALAYGWVLASAAALWWRHVWLRQAGQRLATIALELDRHLGAGGYRPHLQRALAAALGDPGLRVARRVADGTFVDTHGRAVTPVPERDGQVATPVRSGGRTIAVVLHDASLWRDPELPTTALATVRAATDRLHLSDAVRTQARSALAERHRIQRDLHDGAQYQFLAASLLLDIAGQRLAQSPHSAALVAAVGEAQRHLAAALRSLRELTAGVYPQTLVEHGLVVALRELCCCSPIPVTLDAEPARWPGGGRGGGVFRRHRGARQRVPARARPAGQGHRRGPLGRLCLTVTDDGCGGRTTHDGDRRATGRGVMKAGRG
jgi:signal transduction histidine kinase